PWVDPVGDDRRRHGPARPRCVVVVGKVSSLGDGGGVGSVVREDGVEDVAGFAGIGRFGDDVHVVLLAAAGGAHVEATMGGGRGDEFDGDVDGVAFGAMLGGRVAQPDVLIHVIGGQGRDA